MGSMKSTTTPGMQAAAAQFDQTDTHIQGIATNLRSRVANMNFKSATAAPRFQMAMQRWDQEFGNVRFHIGEMSAILRGQASTIQATEDENARLGNFM